MAIAVTIAGTERKVHLYSFRADLLLNGHDNISAIVLPSEGSPEVRFHLDDPVVLSQDGTPIAGGVVTNVDEDGPDGQPLPEFWSRLTIAGWGEILTRRHVTFSTALGGGSPSAGLSDVLQALVDEVGDGLTLHPSQAAGPSVKAMTWEDRLPTEILNWLAQECGMVWRVDEAKQLRMWAKGDIPAPYDIDAAALPAKYFNDIRKSISRFGGYANRVIVKGQKQTVFDHGETYTSDGIQTVYPVSYTVIGTRAGSVPVTNVPSMGIPDGQVLYESLRQVGQPYDTIWELDKAAGTFTRLDGPLPSGAVIRTIFDGERNPRGEANDLTDQAGSPVRDEVVTAQVETDADAQALADQILPYLVAAKETRAKYSTREHGLIYPGHTQQIDVPERGLAGEFLITRVTLRYQTGDVPNLVRDIDMTQGEILKGDWRDLLNQFVVGPSASTTTTANGGNNNNNGGSTTTNPDGDGSAGGELAIPPYHTDVISNQFGALGTVRHGVGRIRAIASDEDDVIAGGSPGESNRCQLRVEVPDTPSHQPFLLQGGYQTGQPGTVDTDRPTFGWIPWAKDYHELLFNIEIIDSQYIATSSLCFLIGVYTAANGSFFTSMYRNQTPGDPVDFTGVLNINFGGDLGLTGFVGFGVGAEGGTQMGATAPGPCIMVNHNTDGSGAAGSHLMHDKNGNAHYLWVDATGDVRIHNQAPTADGSVSDTAGVVVGAQS